MTKLTAQLVQQNEDWSLKVIGEVDSTTSRPIWLSDILDTIAQARVRTLIIDLTATQIIDSQGLRLLLDIQKVCLRHNVRVVLRNPSSHLRRLFQIMQFRRLFVIE